MSNEVRTRLILDSQQSNAAMKEAIALQERLNKAISEGTKLPHGADFLGKINLKSADTAGLSTITKELKRLLDTVKGVPKDKVSSIMDKGMEARTKAHLDEIRKWGSVDNLQRKYPTPQGTGIDLSSSQAKKGGGDKFNFLNPLGLPGKLGEMFGILGKLQIAFWELSLITTPLKAAFAQLASTVKEVANIYIQSAQLGRAPGDLFLARKAAEATGMSEGELQSFLLKLLRNGAPGKNNDTNFSARASMFGLSKEALEMAQSLAHLRDVMDDVTGKLYNVQFATIQMRAEFEALWATFASGMSGALRSLMETFSDFAKVLTEMGITKDLGVELGAVFMIVNKAIGLLLIGLSTVALGFKFIGFTVVSWLQIINNAVVEMFPTLSKLMGLSKREGGDKAAWQEVEDGAVALKEMADKWLTEWNPEDEGRKGNRVPPVAAMTLPAGQWEKLGLSFGGGPSSDYAKQTAFNTKRIADILSNPRTGGDYNLIPGVQNLA
jgi:hypothetical protein